MLEQMDARMSKYDKHDTNDKDMIEVVGAEESINNQVIVDGFER